MHQALFLLTAIAPLLLTACSPGATAPAPIEEMRIVDLTHDFDGDTVYWATDTRGFQLEQLASGETQGGWFYSANAFCTAEHGGTHIDAPIHFSEDGLAVNEVPLSDLVGPAVAIDISEEAADNPDYRLTLATVAAHEARHGRIPEAAIVLLRTGWSECWPDVRAYLGDDTPGDASNLSFPSYGEEAAQFLIDERGVRALGVDTASIDYGRASDFPVHRLAAAKQVSGPACRGEAGVGAGKSDEPGRVAGGRVHGDRAADEDCWWVWWAGAGYCDAGKRLADNGNLNIFTFGRVSLLDGVRVLGQDQGATASRINQRTFPRGGPPQK